MDLSEMRMLCDQVAIIDNGEVITKGTPKNLTGEQGDSGITINLSETEVDLKNHLKEFSYSLIFHTKKALKFLNEKI